MSDLFLKRRWMVWLCLLTAILGGLGVGTAAPPADQPVQEFPLGVYWPWERTEGIAKNAGLEQWAFVAKTCHALHESGVDAIWVVNIDLNDTKRLLKVTQSAGIKLIPCLGEIEIRNRPETRNVVPDDRASMEQALAYYRTVIPQVVQVLGDDRAGVLAWVLGDEPSGNMMALLEPMRELFVQADPDRPVMTVTMWPDTPTLIEKTRLSTFCADLYPFFGPDDPNGPHTPAASAQFYTSNLLRMVAAAGKDGRIGWAMPQCFNEVSGPWERRPDGLTVALPGSYYHWRTPTEAEMRWQTWEALRCGVKGVLFFALLGPPTDNPDAKPTDEPSVKSLLIKTPTVVGYDAMLDFQGRPTPQFTVVSGIFRTLAKQKSLLRRLSPSTEAWLTADGDAAVGCFVDPETKEKYAFLVNPDRIAGKVIQLSVEAPVQAVVDVFGKRQLAGEWKATEGTHPATIELEAGGGALLKAR